MNGTIIIDRKNSIRGAKIRNGSGFKAQKFLEAHSHLFQRISDGPMMDAHYLTNDRIEKFIEYTEGKGFKIEVRA